MTGAKGKLGYDWRDDMAARKDLDGQYAGTLLIERALQTINNHDASIPMFMYFAHSGVHTPIQVYHQSMLLYMLNTYYIYCNLDFDTLTWHNLHALLYVS